MEQRRLIFGIALAMAIILMWQPAFVWIGRRMGYDMTPRQLANTTPATAESSSQPATTNESSFSAAGNLHIAPASQPALASIGSIISDDPVYRLGMDISPQGAGLNSVVLNEFNREARSKDPYKFQEPFSVGGPESRAFATRSISIDGGTVNLADATWTLEKSDVQNANYGIDVAGPTGVVARVHKSFHLLPADDGGKGYEVLITQTVENLSDHAINVKSELNGPTMPPRESDRGGDRQVLSGYDNHGFVEVGHDMIESFAKDKAFREYARDANGNPLLWAGSMSIYFQSIVLSGKEAGGTANQISKVSARALNPESPSDEHQVALTFDTTETSIAPHESSAVPLRVFFGPRQRKLLESSFFSAFPRAYNETLVLTSGFCGYCTFQWLVSLLVTLLRVFHFVLRDWGLAIIGLVVLVRAILHPITKRSQISMANMGKMGPEIEKLKKKHGDNKEELNKAMMQFYKTQGATPILGCLPMFLQMPIWLALWQSLQSTFELRQAPFLQFFGFPLTWIHDLSKPDHLIELAHPFNLFGYIHVSGLNLLPFLLAAVFWLQMKFQPKPAAVTPEQQQQQKMMQWMTLLFPVMLYSGPSGLNLYIMTSTAIGIVEGKIIRDHIKEREEAEKAGRVFVDPGRKKFRTAGDAIAKSEKTPGKLAQWFANLQQKAEDVRRDADKRK